MVEVIFAALLKMAFILGVLVLLFAPVFVLFERRQSAMIQDRLGPYMAGVPVPRAIVENIPLLQSLGYASAVGAALTAGLSLTMAWLGHAEEPGLWVLPISWGALFLVALVAAPLQAFGARILPHLFHHNRLTLFGGLHALFDAIKAFTKEDIVPPRADRVLYTIAPIISMIPAFALGAVIPFGPDVYPDFLFDVLPSEGEIQGKVIRLQVADLNVGILYVFAIGGMGVISAAIAGYSSDNKYALLGGIRAASQMVSYEVTLGLSLVGCFMLYDT
ncbi:MAG: NADH-quinone oxidoreductase subunit H, partial [Sandaracinaceae bacterium]|nr:NADH-quinone oxidoreductase subunit H [Sandaracinaceae bacterium]